MSFWSFQNANAEKKDIQKKKKSVQKKVISKLALAI